MLGKSTRRVPENTVSRPIQSGPTERTMTTATKTQKTVSPDIRRRMVEETAYYLAQKRDFQPGHELEDWLAAEHQVVSKLGK